MYSDVQQLMSMLTGYKVSIYYLPCTGISHESVAVLNMDVYSSIKPHIPL